MSLPNDPTSKPSIPAPPAHPAAAAGAPRSAPGKRVVVPATSAKETAIAVACGVAVLAIVFFAIFGLNAERQKPSTNQLTGIIIAKNDTLEREEQIQVGKKGLKRSSGDTGLSFDVRVEAEDRVYEVPVTKATYDAKKVGDKQTFIRPPSEQR